MGYYATWNGGFELNETPSKDVLNKLNDVFGETYLTEEEKYLEVYGHEKYYEDEIYNVLEEIKPIVKSGDIKFTGEDEAHWRIYFENNEWKEENGSIYYDSEINKAQDDKEEFIGRIIDVIQDSIDNPKGDTIKGKWYDEIYVELTSIMKAWKVFS